MDVSGEFYAAAPTNQATYKLNEREVFTPPNTSLEEQLEANHPYGLHSLFNGMFAT